MSKNVGTGVVCESCGNVIQDVTFDVWLFETRYDEQNEPISTGEELINLDAGGKSYLVVGECCREKLQNAWQKFVTEVTS